MTTNRAGHDHPPGRRPTTNECTPGTEPNTRTPIAT